MAETSHQNISATVRRLLQVAVRIGAIGVLVWGILAGLDLLLDALKMLDGDMAVITRAVLIFVILLIYAFVLAIPFAPGVEIGVAVLMIAGPSSAPFVYLATVTGLMFAFAIGQFANLRWLSATASDLRMTGLAAWFKRVEATPPQDRLNEMERRLPLWLGTIVCRWRYLSIALLINLPGNFALGGGGGIMVMAGLSRLFSLRVTFVTVALAVAPVPLAFWTLGRLPALPFWTE